LYNLILPHLFFKTNIYMLYLITLNLYYICGCIVYILIRKGVIDISLICNNTNPSS